jgi:hypothetical protein
VNLQTIRAKWPVGIGATIALIVLAHSLVPHIDRVRFPAEVSSAVGTLRNAALAQKEFRVQHGCFASKLSQLEGLTWNHSDDYRRYTYALFSTINDNGGCMNAYVVTATPTIPRKGFWYFSIDETEVVRYETSHAAGRNSPVLQ